MFPQWGLNVSEDDLQQSVMAPTNKCGNTIGNEKKFQKITNNYLFIKIRPTTTTKGVYPGIHATKGTRELRESLLRVGHAIARVRDHARRIT